MVVYLCALPPGQAGTLSPARASLTAGLRFPNESRFVQISGPGSAACNSATLGKAIRKNNRATGNDHCLAVNAPQLRCAKIEQDAAAPSPDVHEQTAAVPSSTACDREPRGLVTHRTHFEISMLTALMFGVGAPAISCANSGVPPRGLNRQRNGTLLSRQVRAFVALTELPFERMIRQGPSLAHRNK